MAFQPPRIARAYMTHVAATPCPWFKWIEVDSLRVEGSMNGEIGCGRRSRFRLYTIGRSMGHVWELPWAAAGVLVHHLGHVRRSASSNLSSNFDTAALPPITVARKPPAIILAVRS
ncbi:uncharacterized protein [Zea mays]|uniref:uncharacterized protein n=1 Tax=Zea mays TaxID=4577 RepID=UPI0004DE9843|nr:uncharacterized protein LOC103650793 [Zea mays]|eukprot:XP_008674581.1 uncharacterized protein LOC103650793 [Zea mays]